MFELTIKSSHKVSSLSIHFGEEDNDMTVTSAEPKPVEKKNDRKKELSSRTPQKSSKALGGGFDISKVDNEYSSEQVEAQKQVVIPDIWDREPAIESSMSGLTL